MHTATDEGKKIVPDKSDPEPHDEIIDLSHGVPEQLIAEVPPLPTNIYSEFGFKLIYLPDKEDVPVWTVATEEDRRETHRLLGIETEPSERQLARRGCYYYNGCGGDCPSGRRCVSLYNRRNRHATCVCR